jgi:hypothetical protein
MIWYCLAIISVMCLVFVCGWMFGQKGIRIEIVTRVGDKVVEPVDEELIDAFVPGSDEHMAMKAREIRNKYKIIP